MKTIRYSIHFPALVVAMVVFWFAKDIEPFDWIPKFIFSGFGLMGALHAMSIVVSLRGWKASRPIAGLGFIILAYVWSAATPFLGLWGGALLLAPSQLGEHHPAFGTIVIFLGGSAIGCLGYWLFVRLFWFETFLWKDCLRTMALCMGATLLSFAVVSVPKVTGDFIVLILTVAWWFAFSISLYWSESSGNAKRSTEAINTVA